MTFFPGRPSRLSTSRGSPLLLSIGLLPGLLACGASAVPAGHHADARLTVPPQLPAHRVQVVAQPDRPILQLVRRNGDPHGAVALAAFPEGGSRGAAALGALLKFRLRAAEVGPVELQPHAYGLVVALPVDSPTAAERAFRALRAALEQPVQEADPALPLVRRWLEQHPAQARQSLAGLCAGQFGSDGNSLPETFSAELLESWRKSAFTRARIGLAALGSEQLLKSVRAADDEPWPAGPPLEHPWPESDEVQVVDDGTDRALRLAWHVPEASRALAVARTLADRSHALHHRLAALGRWQIVETNATIRPRGACLRLDMSAVEGGAKPTSPELAETAAVVSKEIERALVAPPGEQERERTLLAPSKPTWAAALAAWSAVRASEPGGPVRRIVEYSAPATERRPSPSALAQLIDETLTTWEGHELPVKSRLEDGQAEAWLLVASPCGTRGEAAQDAGALALATHSLARAFQDTWGVTLEPWATPDGVGLLAHAPPQANESPLTHAERLARAVGRALAGDPLLGQPVADARAAILDRLGADTGWWLTLETVSGDFPSALEPFGSWKTVSTASTSGVERARAALAQGPLRVAFVADQHPRQADAAANALADWLAPFRTEGALCPASTFQAPRPGLWTLETIDEEVREGAYVSTWLPGPRELGQATAYLLNRPGGWLDKALEEPGLVATAQARWLGGGPSGALVIELGAPSDQLDGAIQQTRALLERLAEGAAEASDVARARAEQVRREEALRLTPRGRIVELWHDREPIPVALKSLREFHKALAADQHLVVRVKRRR